MPGDYLHIFPLYFALISGLTIESAECITAAIEMLMLLKNRDLTANCTETFCSVYLTCNLD